MSIAEKWLANRYNRPGFEIFNHRIYAVCGDGCLMEGISSEAASLAGHLGLDNLCWIFDNNHITIEGDTNITFTEDVAARFLAYGWNVLRVSDANDVDRIEHALQIFRQTKGRPTFIVLDSHIGYGSPNKQGKAVAHGEPLGEEEVRLTKRYYAWPEDAEFLVPDGRLQPLRRGHRRARRECQAQRGSRPLMGIVSSIPSSLPKSTRSSGVSSRLDGIATSQFSQPIRKASQGGKLRAKF